MAKQKAFFLSKLEIYEQSEEGIAKARRKPRKSSGRTSAKKKPPKVFDCFSCGLLEKSKIGKVERQGKGALDILLVDTKPHRTNLFRGESYELLNRVFKKFGIDIYEDCVMTSVLKCPHPGKPKDLHIKCCKSMLDKDIEEVKPQLIICFGGEAINAVLQQRELGKLAQSKMHGKVIPSQTRNCWVACSLSPGIYIGGKYRDEIVLENDIATALGYIGEPLPVPLTVAGNLIITESNEAIDLLDTLCLSAAPVALDYECTCFTPYQENPRILTIGLANKVEEGYCIPIGMPGVFSEMEQAHIEAAMQRFLKSKAPKVVQNHAMEELWSSEIIGETMNNFIWDTMVSNHVMNCVRGGNSLAFQVFELVGIEYKDMVDASNLINEDLETVCNYNIFDARYTLMSFLNQHDKLGDDVFNKFLNSCIPALTKLKAVGVPIDKEILDGFEANTVEEREKLTDILVNLPTALAFAEQKESEFNVGSPLQQAAYLYDFLNEKQPKKKRSADEENLNIVLKKTKNAETKIFIKTLLKQKKLTSFMKRAVEYQGILDKNNRIHPSYNLHVAESYRSSSTNPNIQNVFKHDKELVKFRKCIIPSPGNFFLECDYGALEVRVIAMISKDPVLIQQIKDDYDLHHYWAQEVYDMAFDKKTEDGDHLRYTGKNGFVFPSFYGSQPEGIVRSFDGISLQHIKKVQEKFWETYANVKNWQEGVIDSYLKKGYITGVSGFKRPGPLNDFQCINGPIQGTAFHLLLAGLKKITREIERRNMKTRAVLEVHDSILFDTVPDEAEEIMAIAEKILCSKQFTWQGDVSMVIDWCGGANWYEMSAL